jgi:uncharacterized protein YjbI with pentapeptide repeats
MNFSIPNRWTGAVSYTCELTAEIAAMEYRFQLGFAVMSAAKENANLRYANLCGADLCGANLRYANLCGADLRGANLCGANLCGADLCGANLRYANLCGADLCGANLRDANLHGANLCGADLCGANLRGADLRGADLRYFRADFIAEVLKLPAELDNLRGAIIAGRIDGSTYSGECACLAGTLAKAHFGNDVEYNGDDIPLDVLTFVADSRSPREQWFMLIGVGDTSKTNQASKIALEWLDEAIAMRDNIRRMGVPCS